MEKFSFPLSVTCKGSLNAAKKHVASLPVNVFSHLVSNKHKKAHRFAYGVSVGLIGVILAHSGGKCGIAVVEVFADFGGYMLHAVGCIPFIDHFVETFKLKDDSKG